MLPTTTPPTCYDQHVIIELRPNLSMMNEPSSVTDLWLLLACCASAILLCSHGYDNARHLSLYLHHISVQIVPPSADDHGTQ